MNEWMGRTDGQSGNSMYPNKHSMRRYKYFMCTEMGRQSVHKIKIVVLLVLKQQYR